MCDNCKKLEAELTLAENKVKYERNKYEQMFIGKQTNLMSEVRSIIGLELDGIKGIANRLPQTNNLYNEQKRLLRYIRRIEERIKDLM